MPVDLTYLLKRRRVSLTTWCNNHNLQTLDEVKTYLSAQDITAPDDDVILEALGAATPPKPSPPSVPKPPTPPVKKPKAKKAPKKVTPTPAKKSVPPTSAPPPKPAPAPPPAPEPEPTSQPTTSTPQVSEESTTKSSSIPRKRKRK